MLRRLVVLSTAISLVVAALAISPGADAAVVDQAPTRVLDTRIGLGAAAQAVQPGRVLKLALDSVPQDGDTTVFLNLTSTGATAPGYVSAWSCADPAPATSILNFAPGRSTPNMMALRYTSAGVCFSASSAVHLIADLTGTTTGGDLKSVAPARLLDTRTSKRLVAGREYQYRIAGQAGIPTNAAAAALNVTVVKPDARGYVLVKPCGSSSSASTINFDANETVPHFTFSGLGGGNVCVTSLTDTDLIIDVFGSMPSSSAIQAVTPARLLDTRSGHGGTVGAVGNGQLVRMRVAGYAGVPNNAAGATINIVAVGGGGFGYVTAWPCDRPEPVASTINLWPGMTRSNQATLSMSQSGEVCLRTVTSGSSGVNLVVDAVGYLVGNVDRTEPAPTTTPPTTPPTTTPPTTTPPAGEKFKTLPLGSALPSGATCASLVRPTARDPTRECDRQQSSR